MPQDILNCRIWVCCSAEACKAHDLHKSVPTSSHSNPAFYGLLCSNTSDNSFWKPPARLGILYTGMETSRMPVWHYCCWERGSLVATRLQRKRLDACTRHCYLIYGMSTVMLHEWELVRLIHYLYLSSGATGVISTYVLYTLFFLSVLPLRIELMQLCWPGWLKPLGKRWPMHRIHQQRVARSSGVVLLARSGYPQLGK